MLRLVIGNKNYSSWSMRTWVLMRQTGIAFEETLIPFDDESGPDSPFKRAVLAVSPAARVPVLVDEDNQLTVWDSLAIAEYLAERYPEARIWPAAATLRALARSACAEMHSGFAALRTHCPMNVEASLPEAGALIWRDRPDVRADVARLVDLWRQLLNASGGPLLCGEFSAADATFAPVCLRLQTYTLPLPDDLRSYVARVLTLPAVQAWCDEARREASFLVHEEPYRLAR